MSTGRKGKTHSLRGGGEKSQSPAKDITSAYSINNLRSSKQANQLYQLAGENVDRAIVTPCNIYTSLPHQRSSSFRNGHGELFGGSSDLSGILRRTDEEPISGFVPASRAEVESSGDEEEKEPDTMRSNGGGGDLLEHSVITEHCDSEESPHKRATERKKRANTVAGNRSISSHSSKPKRTHAVPLVNTSGIGIGGRKNSAQEASSGGLNIITTPRQSSQLLPASAIITTQS